MGVGCSNSSRMGKTLALSGSERGLGPGVPRGGIKPHILGEASACGGHPRWWPYARGP